MIVTSRILGYRRKILSDAGFIHFTLQDLDEKQVETFIKKWYQLAMNDRLDDAQERSKRILSSFKDSASIRQLAGNPMLLTIMAIIGKHQELPRERWKLYDHAASVLIQHWDVNKHLKLESIDADFIGEDDKKELLRRLAYRMQSGEGGLAGNYIYLEGLQEEFESYLKERYSQAPAQAKIIAKAMIQQFRERNFILSLYGANLYGFVHRAFLEYFCASAFVWKFEKTKELTIEQLKTDVYGEHWEDQSWHEVLRLICGMVDEGWVGQIINYLNAEVLHSKSTDFLERSSQSTALAVKCIGEIRNIGLIMKPVENTIQKSINLFCEKGLEDEITTSFDDAVLSSLSVIAKSIKRKNLHLWLRQIIANNSGASATYYHACSIIISEYGIVDVEFLNMIIGLSRSTEPWFKYLFAETIFKVSKDFSNLTILFEAIRNQNFGGRSFDALRDTISEFVKYYREDKRTLPLLLEHGTQDGNGSIRGVALSVLVKYYHENADILLLLKECIMYSKNVNSRCIALSSLVENYRENAGTLPFLRERAVNDTYNPPKEQSWIQTVRQVALTLIIENYREDAHTLSFLRERAVQDPNSNVRLTVMSQLTEYYREDTQTLSLLRDRVINDTDASVRLSALRSLGQYFKEDTQTLSLLRDRAINDADASVRSSAVRSLGQYFKQDVQTLPLLRDRAINDADASVRSSAVDALGEYFKEDAQTLPLLRDRVINDADADVRSSAVDALWQHFKEDAQTLLLLQDWAANSQYADVRSSAMDALGQYFKEDVQTLPLLRDRAINDADANVRSSAMDALGQYFKEDAQTLSLLQDSAINDADASVRSSAVYALGEYFKEDAQTLPLLKDRAINDESPQPDDERRSDKQRYVRDTAIEAIAKYWRSFPDTLTLLHDRAENDLTPWLRDRAKKLIKEIEKRD